MAIFSFSPVSLQQNAYAEAFIHVYISLCATKYSCFNSKQIPNFPLSLNTLKLKNNFLHFTSYLTHSPPASKNYFEIWMFIWQRITRIYECIDVKYVQNSIKSLVMDFIKFICLIFMESIRNSCCFIVDSSSALVLFYIF